MNNTTCNTEFDPNETRTCDRGHTFHAEEAVVSQGYVGTDCPTCYDRNLFSDIYKDEVGIRPDLSMWDDDAIAGWLNKRFREAN